MEPRQALALYQTYMTMQKGYAPGTVKEYSWAIRSFCDFMDEEYPDVKIDKTNLAMLDHFFAVLLPRNLARSTVCNIVVALRSFFDWAVSRGYIASSPAQLLRRPKRNELFPRCLADQVLAKTIAYIDGRDSSRNECLDIRDRTLVALFLYSGLRRAEASSLNWSDVDFSNGKILVRQGKGGLVRAIPLHPVLAEKLLQYREHSVGSGPIFRHLDGTRLAPSGITDTFRKHVQPETSTEVTPHPLRHTFATCLLDSHIDLRVIQRLLGHKSLASTQIYTRVSTTLLQHAIKSLHFKLPTHRPANYATPAK